MEQILKEVLETQATRLARETGFIQRERAFSGADFVQGLVFGWLATPQARLNQLTQALAYREVEISASGLHQRLGPEAARFLHAVLQELASHALSGQRVAAPLLAQFAGVIIEDSTTITLPEELQSVWRGCGDQQVHTAAGLKLHVRWDLVQGTLQGPLLSAARLSDQRSALRSQPLPPATLYIADEGYFSLPWLRQHAASGGFFLSRTKCTTAFFDEAGARLDLVALGPQAVHQVLERPVLVGVQVRLPARLVMIRVPEEVAEQRREQIRQTARKHHREPTQQHLDLACWTILITNVPASRLDCAQVVVLARARWQIELLFKLWKSDGGQIETWRSRKPWRILCEVYAKLMAMLIQHWTLIQGTWPDPARSLVKAAAVVRSHAFALQEVLLGERCLSALLARLERLMRQGCQVDTRSADPSFFQLVLHGLNWPLT